MVVRSRGCCTYREEGIKRGEWSYSRVCYHHKAVAPTFPAKKNMLKGAEEGGRRRVLEATAAGGKYSRRHATASFERLPLPVLSAGGSARRGMGSEGSRCYVGCS